MIKTVLTATAMMGIVFISVGPTLATLTTPSWIKQPLGTIEELSATLAIEQVGELSIYSHRYFVQRPSSKPPGESRSGRVSSSPAGNVPESKRDSGRTLDPTEDLSHPEIDSTSHQRPEESMVPPPKEGDPLEGGRKSQPATKRRGGVVK